MNMTEIGEHDQKVDINMVNLTENIINITPKTNINGSIWPKINIMAFVLKVGVVLVIRQLAYFRINMLANP